MEATYRYLKDKTLNIVGVAVKEGQDHEGTELGPKALREAELITVSANLGWNVKDLGDISNANLEPPVENKTTYKYANVKNASLIGEMCRQLHETTKQSAAAGAFTLVLGGDHGVATGSISGLKAVHKNLKVVWVDAHGDCNIPESSPSGNYHGMPVAHLLGWIPEGTVPGFDWLKPVLDPSDIVYVGLRSLDEFEKKKLAEERIKVYDMDEISGLGIGTVMKEITEYFNSDGQEHPIHISFDIDAIDPIYAPHTGTKARGGLSYREAHYIVRKIAQTGCLVGMDLVEINPILSSSEPRELLHGDNPLVKGAQTVCLGVELILSGLGYNLSIESPKKAKKVLEDMSPL